MFLEKLHALMGEYQHFSQLTIYLDIETFQIIFLNFEIHAPAILENLSLHIPPIQTPYK